jgi:hypothetical protein
MLGIRNLLLQLISICLLISVTIIITVSSANCKIAVLVNDASSLDSDENNIVDFMNSNSFDFDIIDSNLLKNDTIDLSNYNIFYMRSGSEPSLFNNSIVIEKIRNRVETGASIILEYYGLYLAEYISFGNIDTHCWSPYVLDASYFVETSLNSPIFMNINSWSPPVLPDLNHQLIAELNSTGYYCYPSIDFLYPSHIFLYKYLISTYGFYGQSTTSSYCIQYPGLCTGDRSVYDESSMLNIANDIMLEILPVGDGRVVNFGMPILQHASASRLNIGPIANQVRVNVINNADTLGYSAYIGHIYQAPMSGTPGTAFTEGGIGFTPNSTVTLQFRNHLGQLQTPLNVATDASGAFSLTYTAPVDKPLGTHTWWAVDDTTGNMSAPLGYLIYEPGSQTPIDTGTVSGNLGPIKIDLGFGQLTSQGTFDPTKETFVIIHGWNTENTNSLPPWMTEMGDFIKNGDTKNNVDSPAQGANVLYWNWRDKAKAKIANVIWDQTNDESCADFLFPADLIYPPGYGTPGDKVEIPFDETENSGKYLAAALLKALPKTYNQDIHLIGHSLGTLVSTYAAQFATD